MRAVRHFIRMRISRAAALLVFCLAPGLAPAATVNAVWNSASDVPVTANGYTATGSTVNFTLNFAPATGTDLLVVKNTALGFIAGTFDNLAQGQAVALSYDGVTYPFVANYYGGSGNDLVLVWASRRAFAWGRNDYSQLGDAIPGQVRLLTPVTATGVLAGKTVIALAGGNAHSLALCSDGTVAAWGDNTYGQLGTNVGSWSITPVAVNAASGSSALYGKTVVAIAAGYQHSLALCSDGTVSAWGLNNYGQLGDNTTLTRTAPVAVNTAADVSALHNKTVVAIAAGERHNLALCSDGTVAAWGLNGDGQLGDNSTTNRPVPVAVNSDSGVSALYGKTVVAIAAGGNHNLALCSNGKVTAWGLNGYGQLGDNSTTDRLVPVAVWESGPLWTKTLVAIAAGHEHSLALNSEGAVAAWGGNYNYQLGDNTYTDRHVPVAVNTNSGSSALNGKLGVALTAGGYHNLVLCADGTVAAWGANASGQLGDNSWTQRIVPVAMNTAPLAPGQRLALVVSGSTANHTLGVVAAPPAAVLSLIGPQKLTNGSFQFAFTNTAGAFFGVVVSTNPALPLSTWTSLTGLTEVSPGQFQFTDPQATNTPRRFYRVRSP